MKYKSSTEIYSDTIAIKHKQVIFFGGNEYMGRDLYSLMGCKRKNSILKSVTVSDITIEGYRVINVEPYDSTGVNALDSTPGRYDKALETIENTLKSFIPGEKVRICVYSNVRRPIEYLFQC